MKFIVSHTAANHDRRWLVFAGEDDPDEFWVDMIEVVLGKPKWKITQEERLKVSTFLRPRVRLLEISESQPATFASVKERMEESILCHGTTDLLIDPWNAIEVERGGKTMSDYICDCLTDALRLTRYHGCNVWFNTHPPKMRIEDRDGRLTGYDIADSAHWGNKPDLGLSIRKLKDTGQTELYVWKAKRRRWGKSGKACTMDFLQDNGRFIDPVSSPEPPPPPNDQDRRYGTFD
jgi:twinkle protein